ncbi:hypothetical protein [Cytobacillus firmus]
MEKIIVKTGIYSFIVSFFLLVAFMKRIESTTDVDGMISSVITPYPEFFFTIFRYSVITSIIAVKMINKRSCQSRWLFLFE